MTPQAITHILVVSGSDGVANRLIGNLRNDGMQLRAANASTDQELTTLIKQDQWEILIWFENSKVTVATVLALLQRHEQDLPVIVATTADKMIDLLHLLNLGVSDVVPQEQAKRLLLSVQREASNYLLKRRVRQLETSHHELEKRHRLILETSDNALSYIQDGIHLYCNKSYADVFGYSNVNSITTTPLLNLMAPQDRNIIKALLVPNSSDEHAVTVTIQCFDGSQQSKLLTFTPVNFDNKICMQLAVRPAKGNPAYSEELAHLQTLDLLTRLENRTHFLTRIEAAISKAVQQGIFSSLLVIAVNEFVDISTAIGKSNANMVLSDIARFLKDFIQKPFSAARMDEHSFGVIIYDGDPDEVIALSALIKSRINNRISPAMLPSLELSCSIGMALINGHALDAQTILNRAHSNLKQQLHANSSQYQFHIAESLHYNAKDMLEYLDIALAQKRFKLLYQPIVHIKGDNLAGYEVLTRMLDKDSNEILPSAFFPLANLNGMGENIDRLVFSMVLELLHNSPNNERLIVTISSSTLMSRTFLPWLNQAMQVQRIPAHLLAIKISEIDIHNNPSDAGDFCQNLLELGLQLIISHFGCALEPFAMLDQLRPQLVKLDETVVRDLTYSSYQKVNIQNLIHTLHTRGVCVAIPHVENIAVLPILWETGADYVQGDCLQAPTNKMNYNFMMEEITLTAAPN